MADHYWSLLVPPRNDVWLTRVEISYQQRPTEDDQWGVTTQSASDWLKQVSVLKLWIYENHICELRSVELFEGRSSQFYTQLMQLRKQSLNKIQTCTGFEPLTSAIPVQRSTSQANKPTGSRKLNWFVINPWKDNDEIINILQCTVKSYMWAAEWRIIWRKVIAVVFNTTYPCSCEKKAWKKFRP